MAKRKRLSPAGPSISTLEPAAHAPRRPPIADVAGDAAAQAALQEVSSELEAARSEGRMVLSLPLSAVRAGYLVRDRVVLDPEEMAVLKDSLRAGGQQTPIEVVDLGEGAFGLISGWRRLAALQALCKETADMDRFGQVKALLRAPETATEAYRAMVEENEIRAGLSFYERAHIALRAVEQGVYPDFQAAVQGLFAAARAPKRSKIVAFASVAARFDDCLAYPAAIPEKLGLAIAGALKSDAQFAKTLRAALTAHPAKTAEDERAIIDRALKKQTTRRRKAANVERLAPGLRIARQKGRVVLSGSAVDENLIEALRAWLVERA